MKNLLFLFVLIIFISSCRRIRIEQHEDELNSRQLSRRVKLEVIKNPVKADKSILNLLILNDGQDLKKLRVVEIVDSLDKKRSLLPLVIVAVHAGDRMQEYGVSGQPDYLGRGSKAGYFDSFIIDELLPYAEKLYGVRKFNSVAIAGCSLGGLSAFDIAWNHPDKINKVGVFSGSFWWRDKAVEDSSYSDDRNRIMYAKLKASVKRPALQYWFYAGAAEEISDRDKDGIIDVIDDTRDIIAVIRQKNIAAEGGIVYKEAKEGKHDYPWWSTAFPAFLVWAFGKEN
jgi:enterochelin esterase-like enzyme